MADKHRQSEEAMLVLLAQEGNSEAFRALVELYDRRLLYFIRRILNGTEDAFDVLQRVWLRVHRNLRTLQSPRAFRVWLYRIAHNHAISALRRSRRTIGLEESPTVDLPDDKSSEPIVDTAEQVHVALGSLSVDHRRVLTLRFLEDMSIEEIAEVVECSTGTVKSRLHYAKAALRRRIEEMEHD